MSFGAAYWLERRREDKAEKRENVRLLADTRVAAMLVGSEILDAQAQLIGALEIEREPGRLKDDQWRTWAPTLAQGLSREEWGWVATAYGGLIDVNKGTGFARSSLDSLTPSSKRSHKQRRTLKASTFGLRARSPSVPSRFRY